jgi:hypothetical protein
MKKLKNGMKKRKPKKEFKRLSARAKKKFQYSHFLYNYETQPAADTPNFVK